MDNFTYKLEMLIDVILHSDGNAEQALLAAQDMNLSAEDVMLAVGIVESQTRKLLGSETTH